MLRVPPRPHLSARTRADRNASAHARGRREADASVAPPPLKHAQHCSARVCTALHLTSHHALHTTRLSAALSLLRAPRRSLPRRCTTASSMETCSSSLRPRTCAAASTSRQIKSQISSRLARTKLATTGSSAATSWRSRSEHHLPRISHAPVADLIGSCACAGLSNSCALCFAMSCVVTIDSLIA
eukprot:6204086-Pleurochrysis_carterae.AAC.1